MKSSFKKSLSSMMIAAVTVGSVIAAPAVMAAPATQAQVSVLEAATMLTGATSPRWIDESRVIVTVNTDESSTDYIVDVATMKAEAVVEGVSGLAVSYDGKKAAYTDDFGAIYVVDLATKVAEKVSSDDKEKFDLQFTPDGTKLIYVEGTKLNVINEFDLTAKTIKKLVADNVENKTDLHISASGKQMVWMVTKAGKVTSDATNVDADNVTIDQTGTEPQLYYIDLSAAAPSAFQVSNSLDNKASLSFVSSSEFVYVSSDIANAEKAPTVVLANKDRNSSTLVSSLEVVNIVTAGSDVYVLGYNKAGKTVVYKYDTNTLKRTRLLSTDKTVTSLTVSAKGQVAVAVATEEGEKVSVVKDGELVDITN